MSEKPGICERSDKAHLKNGRGCHPKTCKGWREQPQGEPRVKPPNSRSQMKPCVKWTDDCQGKKDYDGRLISISTRYWPSGGGFHVLDTTKGTFELNQDGSWPSANAAIHLDHGGPDEYGYGDYKVLREKDFSAATEEEVKAQVEAWVQEQFEDIVQLLGGGDDHNA